jgi:hypothetical protein
MLLDKFPPMTGAASPNRVDVVDGGKDQHGRAARGGVGVAVQIFEQKLEGNWEQPADESNRK